LIPTVRIQGTDNLAIQNFHTDWRERIPRTGTAQTKAIFNSEQSAMGSALNIALTQIEELISLPLEIDTRVWAMVTIAIDLLCLSNHQDFKRLITQLQSKSPASRI
jgi:hypothetical protein